MAIFSAQVILAPLSGASEDVNVNMLAVTADDMPDSTTIDAWQAEIETFYDALKVAGALCGRAVAGHVTKFNAQDTSVPNYPFAERTWSLTGSALALALPAEVSLCVSYANDSLSSIPRARRRGRIYISGWAAGMNASGRPIADAYTDLAQAFQDYAEAVNNIGPLTAVVWSRSNNAGYPIERCWADNEWDTVRSRGGTNTARTELVVLP